MTRSMGFAWIALFLGALAAAQDSQPNPSWEIMRKHDKDGSEKEPVKRAEVVCQ